MSVTKAFTFGVCGSMSPQLANQFDNQMNDFFKSQGHLSGWLGEKLQQVKESHNHFMKSHMWEFSRLNDMKEGQFVGRFEIGYLSEVQYQQQATGFMRDIIMANPNMGRLYDEGRVSGYDSEFKLDMGIARDNYYYNKVQDGRVRLDEERGDISLTHFISSRDSFLRYTTKQRKDAYRTWRASDIHIGRGLDPSNILGGDILSVEDGLKFLEERNKPKEEPEE